MCLHTYNMDKFGQLNKEKNVNLFVKRKYTEQSWTKISGNPRKIRNKLQLLVLKPYQEGKKQRIWQLYKKLFVKYIGQ